MRRAVHVLLRRRAVRLCVLRRAHVAVAVVVGDNDVRAAHVLGVARLRHRTDVATIDDGSDQAEAPGQREEDTAAAVLNLGPQGSSGARRTRRKTTRGSTPCTDLSRP